MFQSFGKEGGITLHAPCKINLHLAVGNKQTDGFHQLESIFIALDFSDTLTIIPLPEEGGHTSLVMRAEGPFLELSGKDCPPIPPEKNLVCRAVELFRAKTGFSGSLAVELVKRIPPGSGLGGGSSDAAATLLALNVLAFSPVTGKSPLSKETLMDMAARLGSDVPFFVRIHGESPACLVSGRGELLTPLPAPPPLGVLLAFPGFSSDTAAAYALLDTYRETLEKRFTQRRRGAEIAKKNEKRNHNSFFASFAAWRPLRDFLREKNLFLSWPGPETWNWSNDFLELFLRHGTEREKKAYQAILQGLRDAGAAFTGLSGSGSACFGIFNDVQAAEDAQKSLSGVFFTLQSTFFLRS